jgi:hypothetical protein
VAVDTRDKRMSMLGFAQGHGFPYVVANPDGSDADDQFERAQFIHLYAGLAIQSGQPTQRRWGGVPHMRVATPVFGRSW